MSRHPSLVALGSVLGLVASIVLRLNGQPLPPLTLSPTNPTNPTSPTPGPVIKPRPSSSTTLSSTHPTSTTHKPSPRPIPSHQTTSSLTHHPNPPTTTTTRTISTTTSIPAPTTTKPPVPQSSSATGPVVNYYYGQLSVTVTVSNHQVSGVKIATINDGGNPQSQYIDQNAIPQLIQEALAAKSANIQSISGASYTSAGFIRSLQGALTSLGI